MRNELMAALLLLAGTPALAADPAKCSSVSDANLPADLRAWAKTKTALTAAAEPGRISGAALGLDRPAEVVLTPSAKVRLVRPPEQVRTPVDVHAGLLALRITTASTYRVAVGTSPWIDMLRDGQPIASTAHGQFAPCTTLHKVVEFPLTPGDYIIQLSGNVGPRTQVMVTKKP